MPSSSPLTILGIGTPDLASALGPLAEEIGAELRLRSEADLAPGLRALADGPWAATLLSLGEDAGDEAVARRVAEDGRAGIFVLTTPAPTVETALLAEALAAAGVLKEPLAAGEVKACLGPLLTERGGLELPDPETLPEPGTIVSTSRSMSRVFELVARVAGSSATVLVTGESGTGKELVARAVHRASARASRPFVTVNCAAIPEHLLEAELFGYEKGAFTGAVGRREGRFGRAHGGTLFLDEIGDMGLGLQAKILRALEEGEIERLGSTETVRVDVRVVAATNRSLEARVAEGLFRSDLLFRLAVFGVELPPLREREGDVRALALHFGSRFAARHARPVRYLGREALDRLETHDWPGNVRELRNVMDRAVLLARGDSIRAADVRLGSDAPRASPAGGPDPGFAPSPTLSLSEVEGMHIARVLRHTAGHMGEAARILGIHRNTMTAKVREHGIDVSELGR